MGEPAEKLPSGEAELPITEARGRLADVVNEAAYAGTVTYLTRHGRRLAAIVPVDAAEAIEHAEDAYLSQLAREALDEMHRDGGRTIPLEQVIAELDL
ncbi:MAG TPA: type II toxin-antitoxin system Phd/YefM family antitoxin [Pseudonocardiaceae bacterium]|jgi:prevent-host-death family protein|nr:type II toxin-antitoxin system Phd/YefM family antitoxin [Pseudonocardiaceae bacterium]